MSTTNGLDHDPLKPAAVVAAPKQEEHQLSLSKLPLYDESMSAPPPPPNVPNIMEELARLIEHPPKPPHAGTRASELMMKHFEVLAEDVERIAKERVEEALALQRDAMEWAAVLRDSGRVLSEKMQTDSARLFQASQVLRQTRAMLAGEVPREFLALGRPFGPS